MQKRVDHKHTFMKNEMGQDDYTCGCYDEKRIVLVSVKVLDNQVDLFDKEFRDNDSKFLVNFKDNPIFCTIQTTIFLTVSSISWTTPPRCRT